jgi:AcrR family transcriptional regulator
MTEVRTQVERAAQARQKLVDAAIKLLAERGYTGTTLEAIGREAGLSRGLVTHHFGNKDACIIAAVNEIRHTAGRELAPAPGVRGMGLVDNLVAVYLNEARTERAHYVRALYVVHADSISEAPTLRESVAHTNEVLRAYLRRCLQQALEDGELPDGADVGSAAVLIEGLLRGVSMQWFVDPERVDLDASITAAKRMIRAGLGATPGDLTSGGPAQGVSAGTGPVQDQRGIDNSGGTTAATGE